MKYKINDLIIGKVNNVKPYAIFMSFDDGSQGLLHISEISNNYIRDIEKYATIGDEIKVKVLSIDDNNGFLRVSLKQVPEEEAYSSHVNAGRKVPEVNNDAFTPLKDKLEGWINDTLKEIEDRKLK